MKAKKNEEQTKKELLQRLMVKIRAKVNLKVIQQTSLVESHVLKMEQFGGKNEIAKQKIEDIQERERLMQEQNMKIEEKIVQMRKDQE